MKILKKYSLLFMATVFLCMACDENIVPVVPVENSNAVTTINQTVTVTGIPIDVGGTHKPYVLGSTAAKFGYYLYTPGGYSSTTTGYPLLIFLHGKGERGDGTNSLTVLNKVLNNGIPKIIKSGSWKPTHPMLVVSPQFHGTIGNLNNWGGGDPTHLKTFIEYMLRHYRIDPKRIYLTGLSHGGNGIYDYLSKQDDATSYIAAAAPVASWGARAGFVKSNDTPIWTFVGKNDIMNFKTSLNFVTMYNAQLPAPRYKAKISVFLNAGHDVWTRTYIGTGIGTADPLYSPFNQALTDWFYQYKRP